jgi:hypothetical protein
MFRELRKLIAKTLKELGLACPFTEQMAIGESDKSVSNIARATAPSHNFDSSEPGTKAIPPNSTPAIPSFLFV